MARKQGWTVMVVFLVIILAAGLYWLYGPFLRGQVARQVQEALQGRQITVELSKGGSAELKGLGPQAVGPRFQLMTDGKQVFLADLKEGRVWRYFRLTREGGALHEDEGFLPLSFYYAGRKYYTAGEVESAAGKP